METNDDDGLRKDALLKKGMCQPHQQVWITEERKKKGWGDGLDEGFVEGEERVDSMTD